MLTGVKAPKNTWQGDLTDRLLEPLTVLFRVFDRQIIRLADSMLHYDNIVISLRKRNKITLGCRGTPQE
jgi:hypothetical protein